MLIPTGSMTLEDILLRRTPPTKVQIGSMQEGQVREALSQYLTKPQVSPKGAKAGGKTGYELSQQQTDYNQEALEGDIAILRNEGYQDTTIIGLMQKQLGWTEEEAWGYLDNLDRKSQDFP